MKLNYKLKLIAVAVVFGVGVGFANARPTTNSLTTSVTQNSDSWVMVKNENGINVYFSKYDFNNKSYLEVKFENTTNQEINFTWSLTKNSTLISNETNTSVEALGTIGRPDTSVLIPINNGETFNSFSLTVNLK